MSDKRWADTNTNVAARTPVTNPKMGDWADKLAEEWLRLQWPTGILEPWRSSLAARFRRVRQERDEEVRRVVEDRAHVSHGECQEPDERVTEYRVTGSESDERLNMAGEILRRLFPGEKT